MRTAVEGALDCARLAIAGAELRGEVAKLATHEELARALVEACMAISTSTSAQEVAGVVEARFPALGISRVAVGLFADEGVGDTVRCVLSLQDGSARVERFDMSAKQFAGRLVPPGELANLIVSALVSDARPFGLVAMDLSPVSEVVHEGVREALSRAWARLGPG